MTRERTFCHCEERSDEAISALATSPFAGMTRGRGNDKMLHYLFGNGTIVAKSPSAFSIHSAVVGFIEDLSSLENIFYELVAEFQSLAYFFRCSHKQVNGKWGAKFEADLH